MDQRFQNSTSIPFFPLTRQSFLPLISRKLLVMTEGIDWKAFKRLWSALIKAGWKARPPLGLNSEHTYTLMRCGLLPKREGLIPSPPSPRRSSLTIGRPPMGKGAAYAAAQRRMAAETLSSGVVNSSVVTDTEQGDDVDDVMVADTEQGGDDVDVNAPVAIEDANLDTERDPTDFEEEKEEDTIGAGNTSGSGLDAFDSLHITDAMRCERLFGPVDADDINISEDFVEPKEEVESVSDPVNAPEYLSVPHESAIDSYESDLESDDEFKDDSSLFEQDYVAMRAMGASGWDIYDRNHSGDLQLDGATDLYTGTWGPTRSAAAYASSPLGMCFYFLPKELWYHIAKESEAYWIECIPSVTAAPHAKQVAVHEKYPTKKIQPLEDLIDKLTKTR
ncbi:unnamed protein product [Phytophthora fragariaefolia]|uniref:Unnamed protein product n=1 Tax=Phytophthora fragariaefolia TaxID=1490495 RepID=A0A9W6XYL7_9STRA|nr:unnamed protein product [Phytophthora fragariaefolia]